jgi:ribosome-associated heat shock protein Hsp15
MSNPESAEAATRLDKWLWAARFFKTRQLAADAVKGGHVAVNGVRAKPARSVRVGDRLSIRKAPFDYVIRVTGLRDRRVSAKEARELYEESAQSMEKRERLRETLRSQARQIVFDDRKPDKRDRRKGRDRKRGV